MKEWQWNSKVLSRLSKSLVSTNLVWERSQHVPPLNLLPPFPLFLWARCKSPFSIVPCVFVFVFVFVLSLLPHFQHTHPSRDCSHPHSRSQSQKPIPHLVRSPIQLVVLLYFFISNRNGLCNRERISRNHALVFKGSTPTDGTRTCHYSSRECPQHQGQTTGQEVL